MWYTTKQTQVSEAAAEQQREVERRRAEQQHKAELAAAEQRHKTELEIAADNQREAARQAYIDKMSAFLLAVGSSNSPDNAAARKIARVRTLTILRQLDPIRKGSVLQFLHEAGLIDKDSSIIDLREADLSNANLSNATGTTDEQLRDALSLEGAIMPNGS